MGRLRIGVVVGLAAALSAVAALAATRADWAVALGPPTTAPRAAKPFAMIVEVAPADDNTESYTTDLTLTPSAASVRIVSWSSAAGIRCTRAGRSVRCSQRSIGGAAPFNELSAVLVLRAAKAGRFALSAKLAIVGDTNVANDTARRTFTVKPAPAKKR